MGISWYISDKLLQWHRLWPVAMVIVTMEMLHKNRPYDTTIIDTTDIDMDTYIIDTWFLKISTDLAYLAAKR